MSKYEKFYIITILKLYQNKDVLGAKSPFFLFKIKDILMIINLDDSLYIMDNRTHSHKIRYIDVINKLIYCDWILDDPVDLKRTIRLAIPARTTENPTSSIVYKSYDVRVFKYGTHDLTVTTKEIHLADNEGNLTSEVHTGNS